MPRSPTKPPPADPVAPRRREPCTRSDERELELMSANGTEIFVAALEVALERSTTNRRLLLAGAAIVVGLLLEAFLGSPLRSAIGSLFGG